MLRLGVNIDLLSSGATVAQRRRSWPLGTGLGRNWAHVRFPAEVRWQAAPGDVAGNRSRSRGNAPPKGPSLIAATGSRARRTIPSRAQVRPPSAVISRAFDVSEPRPGTPGELGRSYPQLRPLPLHRHRRAYRTADACASCCRSGTTAGVGGGGGAWEAAADRVADLGTLLSTRYSNTRVARTLCESEPRPRRWGPVRDFYSGTSGSEDSRRAHGHS